ncbi:hypothetical protein NQV17_07815 [Burkholderia sp. SCN-KJ]|nr:transposase DNA-binding-containing protein [Burkholderia sp. SCN-KJ]MCR4466173.1 hypothetical protein [Burkholderia sp. SCN-KJ]
MEFKGMDLGDKRLNRRAVLLAEQLSGNPTAIIPLACDGWAETAAAYRFFAQDKLEWSDVMEPQWQSSTERMRACEVVMRLDDTTEPNFNGQDITGPGPLFLDCQELGSHSFATGQPQHRELPVPSLPAAMREAQEVKGLRLAPAATLTVLARKASELNQPRLALVGVRPKRASRAVTSRWKRIAFLTFWNPAIQSSACRTTITSPSACRARHCFNHKSNA